MADEGQISDAAVKGERPGFGCSEASDEIAAVLGTMQLPVQRTLAEYRDREYTKEPGVGAEPFERVATPYGYFAEDGFSYVIRRYDTPRPWVNILTNGRYCALVSHTGGGYSFIGSSGYNRITRALPSEMVLADRPGRYVYLRDQETGTYWSIGWQPVCKTPDFWEARHGLGFTTIRQVTYGIEGQITYFVPMKHNFEVWQVTLRNTESRPRNLAVFTYVEWCLGNYAFDLLETGFASLFNDVFYEDGIIFATKRLWNIGHRPAKPHAEWGRYAYLSSSFPVKGFDCIREDFQGMYRSLSNPVSVERGRCSNTTADGKDGVGVLQTEVAMAPGEEYTFAVLVGAEEDKEKIRDITRTYLADTPGEGTRPLFEEVKAFWDEYMRKVWVVTPDPDFDLSVNVWNKYQAWFTSSFARMTSYYIGGGSIIGLRDSSQDVLGVIPMDPEGSRNRILEIMRHQYRDGSCLHNWDPITDMGPKTGHSDDPLWLVLAVSEYLKETGDTTILDENVEFYDGGWGTVYAHLKKSVEFTLARSSDRGIPLMGAGDWNDGLDQVGSEGRGESVMTAEFLCLALRELVAIARMKNDLDDMTRFDRARLELADRINSLFWDGEWYQRATTDSGRILGSSQNETGKIYLNAQSWAVLSDVAPRDKAIKAMDSCKSLLDTRYGPAIFLPAYKSPEASIGIISMFAPGTKENGAIFNHTVCWAVIAETMLGRGDRAYDYWKKTSFVTRGREPEIYKAEPYVYSEYVYGPDSPYFGQGEFTWTTGTAPWMWRACLDWILGVRPEYEGLRISPAIPPEWQKFSVRRPFRGGVYEIEVLNPEGASSGVKEIVVDGRPIEGDLIRPLGPGTHRIKVTMGVKSPVETHSGPNIGSGCSSRPFADTSSFLTRGGSL